MDSSMVSKATSRRARAGLLGGPARPGALRLLALTTALLPATALAQAPAAEPPAAPAPRMAAPEVRAGGITAEAVGQRAAETSFSAKAAEEQLRAAAARVDQAWASYLPRVTGKAGYTRLSDFTPPSLGGSFVGTPQPPGTPNPTPTQAIGFSIPLVLNNWTLEAQIVVPISDYFLRINKAYTAATQSREAARLDVISARAKSASDGKAAFYGWLRARGAVVVAVQGLEDAKIHLNDARNQFAVGNASRADVLRAETAVAGMELTVERAKNLSSLTERQVRVAMHTKEGEEIVPGEGTDGDVPPYPGTLTALVEEAKSNRYEVRSIDANAAAAKKQAEAVRGGAYPQIAAFGTATYANPNPRRFPQTNDWFPTWALGAQLTWSPNDTYSSLAGANDVEARASAAEAQKGAVRDGVELEVTQAFQGVKEADVAIETTKRQIASATEAYRVARELFNNGRGTSTTLTDAETELTRARLEALNARVDARVARVRLEHALGRDAKAYDR